MGHENINLTHKVYRHLMPSAPDRMRSAIDRAMESAPSVRGNLARSES
jgi:hypothetical protein